MAATELADKIVEVITDHVLSEVREHDQNESEVRTSIRFALGVAVFRIARSGLDPEIAEKLKVGFLLI